MQVPKEYCQMDGLHVKMDGSGFIAEIKILRESDTYEGEVE